MRSTLCRFAVWYFAAQGALTAIWWGCVLLVPEWRPNLHSVFLAPDTILLIGGSWASAIGLHRQRDWAQAFMLVTCGAGCYAALISVGLAILAGAWGAMLMLPVLVVPPYLAWRLPQ